MNNMRNKILSLLVLLLTAASGAWAQGETATITLKCGTTEKTYENVTLPWSTTADILKAVVTDIDFNIAIQAISGGDGKVEKNGNENFKVTGTFSGEAKVTVTYNTGSSATITVTAPAPLIELDATKTVATMAAMPAYDATVSYELVRDMAVGFSFKVGSEGEDGFTILVKKDGESYVPSEMTMQEMIALITATDNLDAQNPVTLTNTVDYTVEIFAADADGKPTGDAIAFNQLVPGTTYVAVATGMGAYDGTAQSNTFTLLEAYDLTLTPVNAQNPYNIGAANAKGSVTVEGQAVTPDANGKIKNIEPTKKVKITTTGPDYIIRKATVKKKEMTYTITPRNARTAYDYGNLTNEATLPYNTTTSELMKKVGLTSVNNSYNIQSVSLTSGSNVTLGTPTGTPGERGYEVPLTITGEGEFVLTIGRTNNNNDALIKVIVSANSDN